MDKNQKKADGLEFISKDIPPVANEFYKDKRVEDVLNSEHVPTAKDLNLVDDMISRIKKITI